MRFFWRASKKFGVECECRRSLKAHLRGHGGSLGALRVNLDALMGHCMAQVLVFLKHFLGFLLSRVSLMRMWARRIESMIRVLIFKCVGAGLKFRFFGRGFETIDFNLCEKKLKP